MNVSFLRCCLLFAGGAVISHLLWRPVTPSISNQSESTNFSAERPVPAKTAKTTTVSSVLGIGGLEAFANQFAVLSRTEPAAALNAIKSFHEPFATVAIDVWASANAEAPTQAVSFLVTLDNRGLKLEISRQLVKKLSGKHSGGDIKQIVSPLRLFSDAETQDLIAEGLVESRAEREMATFRKDRTFTGNRKDLLLQLARWNPRLAAEFASQLLPASEIPDGLSAIAGAWMKTDIAGANSWIIALDKEIRNRMLDPLIDAAITNNPYVIPSLVRSLPVGELKPSSIARIADLWTRLDPEMAMQWLLTVTNLAPETLMAGLRQTLNRPSVAAAYLNNFGEGPIPSGFEQILSHADLGGKTPEQGLEWAQTLSDPTARRAATVAALMKGAKDNPEFIAANISKYLPEEPEAKEKFLSLLGARWLSDDFDRASDWLLRNTSGANNAVSESLASAIKDERLGLRKTTELAVSWLARQSTEQLNSPQSSALATTLATEWFRESGKPAQAASLLSGLPDGVPKENALLSLAKDATLMDPYSAAEWISTMSSGSFRDKAVEALVRAIPNDPATAFQWAATVGDSGVRLQLLRNSLEELTAVNPALADRVLQETRIPAEDIEKLRHLP